MLTLTLGGSPKHFQICSVSSALAEQTRAPSGDTARCSARAVCPFISPICTHASMVRREKVSFLEAGDGGQPRQTKRH